MSKTELKNRFLQADLAELWQQLEPLVCNAIVMQATAAAELPLGASRLGGMPDMPADWDWPYHGENPMSLVAQINFAETAAFDADKRLPESGFLYLFYDVDAQVWGYDPEHRSGFCVRYFAGEAVELVRCEAPPVPDSYRYPEDYLLGQHSLQFSQKASYPHRCSVHWQGIDLDEDAEERFEELSEEDDGYEHLLLGHSGNIQDDMETEAQLVTHGINCGSPEGYHSKAAQALLSGASDWVLLLQIDSEEDADMIWGDYGRLYLWIRKQDLAARQFERCHLILQCT